MIKRLALLPALALFIAACGGSDNPEPTDAAEVQTVEITAGATGYSPAQIELEAGVPVRLVFTRTVDSDCLEYVTIPDFGIEATELPLDEPVAVEFTPDEAGTFAFVCGMGMQSGTIVVET